MSSLRFCNDDGFVFDVTALLPALQNRHLPGGRGKV